MSMINSRHHIPDKGDVVESVKTSFDKRIVWIKMKSGKTIAAHVEDFSPEGTVWIKEENA